MDYRAAVAQLMALASPVMQVGDVIPFRRQSIEPGMGLTEGARPNIGGAGNRLVPETGAELAARADAAWGGYKPSARPQTNVASFAEKQKLEAIRKAMNELDEQESAASKARLADLIKSLDDIFTLPTK